MFLGSLLWQYSQFFLHLNGHLATFAGTFKQRDSRCFSKVHAVDVFGKALLEYYTAPNGGILRSHSSLESVEEVPVSYFFRDFEQMPSLEQEALRQCRGSVLDIGCAVGSHSLYLQRKGLNCTGIDISSEAIEIARKRGLTHAFCTDIRNYSSDSFDTLLLLMNGIGIAGTLRDLPIFLKHLKTLLNPGGQILIDSSDIIYMFESDDDGGVWVPGNVSYYGEVHYQWEYKGDFGSTFPWLFLDFNTLKEQGSRLGLEAEILQKGPHFDYLVRLTPFSD